MALKNLFSSALLAAVLSLTSAQAQTPDQDEVAPGIWPTFNNEVHDVLILPDDSFIVGGAFQSVTINGTTTNRSRLVHINANGTLDTNFPTVNSTVYCLSRDSAGRIYVGGNFTTITAGSTSAVRLRVARLTDSFALDTAFNTESTGPNAAVLAVAPVGDGSVYIGGQFDSVGGVTTAAVKRMARLKANGTLDTSFTSGATNDVNTILRLSNGTLYVGGITNYWGLKPGTFPLPTTPFARLVKLSANGGRDGAFKSPDIFTIINEIIQLPNGNLFVAGNVGGQAYVKLLNASNGADLGYAVTGHLSQANCVAAMANGRLLSGALGTLHMTNKTGGKDPLFNVGTRFNDGLINVIKVDNLGRIYVGGNFNYSDGENTRSRFVVLNGSGPRVPAIDLSIPASPTFTTGQNVYALAPTSSAGLPVTLALTSGNASLSGDKLTIRGAGNVVITASVQGNANFDSTSLPVTITVPKQAQTITFPPMIDRPLGSAPFLLAGFTSSGLPVQYEVMQGGVTLWGNLLTLTGTGTVKILASQPGNDDYLPAADVEQEFDVFEGNASALLPQTIVFNPLPPRAANEQAFSIDATATSGLSVTLAVTAGGNIASISENMVTLSGQVGTVTITATQAGNGNYLAAKPVTQTFKVGPAATTLTLTNLIQTYDGDPKPVGTVGGEADTIYYTVNKVKGTTPPTAAGSYPVEAVAGSVKKTGTLVINKAPLLVVASDQRRYVGQANPLLTFAYSGFLESDHAGNALTKVPTVTTKATPTSPGGNYPITPAGGAANNYALVYVSGNMRVETFAGQYEGLLITEAPTLTVGKLELTVLANSIGFTGKMTTSKELTAVSFKGNLIPDFFENSAYASASATVGKGETASTYRFEFRLRLNEDGSCDVSRAVGTQAGEPDYFAYTENLRQLQLLSGKPPVSYAGAHTVVLAPPEYITSGTNALPGGWGYATAAIDAKGKLTLAGMLADGTKITASLLPDADAGYRVFVLPYAGRLDSHLAVDLQLEDHPDLTGRKYTPESTVSYEWSKAPKTGEANYRDGFLNTEGDLQLDPWLPPVAKPTAITLAQRLKLGQTGLMVVSYHDLPEALDTELAETANMDATGKVSTPAPNTSGWKMSIAAATGVFTGSYTALDGTKSTTVNFTGVMRQPLLSEGARALLGAGYGIVPQLTGATSGTLSSAIYFEPPGLVK